MNAIYLVIAPVSCEGGGLARRIRGKSQTRVRLQAKSQLRSGLAGKSGERDMGGLSGSLFHAMLILGRRWLPDSSRSLSGCSTERLQ